MRLAKFLAHAGVASRRGAERLVAEGRVTVGREVVTDPARDVDEHSGVALDGRALDAEPREVWLLNKPAGVVSTARDTHGRPTVVDLVDSGRRLYPVGRLDADTTGLILLTNDGELAELLTHPRHEVEKIYRARVEPPDVSERSLRSLREGVELEEERTAPARVRPVSPGVLEIAIHEGRKRQVRRMCEAVGHRVAALERIGFGPLRLGGLLPGGSQRLTLAEIERLRRAASYGRSGPHRGESVQPAKADDKGPRRPLTQSPAVQLRALRGAITVERNDADAILDATEELVSELMLRNGLQVQQLVSCIFTCTADLDAAFPAEAARRLGLSAVPLLCAQEISVPGSLPRVIRLLMHCHAEPEAELRHVYLREAVTLRRDLEGAQ
jgi:23S rRNA pseudouridine2605 synthase